MANNAPASEDSQPRLFIVSGGLGTSGETLARTILAQFRDVNLPMETFARTNTRTRIESIVERAAVENAAIVHTLVAPEHRAYIAERSGQLGVKDFDVVGPLLEYLRDKLGMEPVGKPGLYRKLHEFYFRRIDAIEYTVEHDDGVNPKGWAQAEIVLTGVSRVGKTSLSLYLSMLGWKVANVPLIMDIPPSQELFELDPRRVVGITMDPSQVIQHRQIRQARLNTSQISPYSDPDQVYQDLEAAKRIFHKGRFRSIDVTGKPIETSADEVITLVTKRLKSELPS